MKKLTLIAILGVVAFVSSADTMKIWDGLKMPGETAKEFKTNQKGHITSIVDPTFEITLAKNEGRPTGFVVICPGGGYNILAQNHEGIDFGKLFADRGISAAILRYRVPSNPDGALMDAQRAVRLVRANAAKWNVDPNKIAIMGFSAGANLAARTSTNYGKNSYEPLDKTDKLSARPDFTVLAYPAYCDYTGNTRRWHSKKGAENATDFNGKYALADNIAIDEKTPPAFIVQSIDDKNYINASLAYALALKDAKVPFEYHIFPLGGHGYGAGKTIPLVRAWTDLLVDWLKYYKF